MCPWLAGASRTGGVGDQLAPIGEMVDVPDGVQERAGEDQVLARDGHQPARLRPVQRVVGDHAIDGRDLGVEEIDLAQPAVLKAVLSASPSAGKNALVFGRTPSQRFEPWTVSALAERA